MIPIEQAERNRWYLTPRGMRVRVTGDGPAPGSFQVETEQGRSFVMEAGQVLRTEPAPAEAAPVASSGGALLERALAAAAAKKPAELAEALQELTDGDLTTVLSRHPVLWVVGAVQKERERRQGSAVEALLQDEDKPDAPVTCPACGNAAHARERGGRWIVVTHPAPDAPVCPGSGRAVDVVSGEAPTPGRTTQEIHAQIRELDTLGAVDAFRADLVDPTKGAIEDLETQARLLREGAELHERAKAGEEEAIEALASWSWVTRAQLAIRGGVRRAFTAIATWAGAEVARIAQEKEVDLAREEAGRRAAERIAGGEDPNRVARALESEDEGIRARVDALRNGVRGAREAARIERDPQVVERALEEERAGDNRPTIVAILEARAAALRGETRRHAKAKRTASEEVEDGLQAEDAAAELVKARHELAERVALLSDEEAIAACKAVVADPDAPDELKGEARKIARLRLELQEAEVATRPAEPVDDGEPVVVRQAEPAETFAIPPAPEPEPEPEAPRVNHAGIRDAARKLAQIPALPLRRRIPVSSLGRALELVALAKVEDLPELQAVLLGKEEPVENRPRVRLALQDRIEELHELARIRPTPKASPEASGGPVEAAAPEEAPTPTPEAVDAPQARPAPRQLVPEGTRRLVLQESPDGETLWADLGEGRDLVRLGYASDPELRELAAAVRRAALPQALGDAGLAEKLREAQRQAEAAGWRPEIQAIPDAGTDKLAAALHALAEALPQARALGIRLTLTIDTKEA